jgi:RimJ/RimL family protein N-acetyltransferase
METGRLLLRRFTLDDWRDLHEYLSQESVVKYEPYEVFTEDASKQEAIRRTENTGFWAVCLKDNGKVIGNIYLAKQEFDTWALGYVFNANYQGMGYATEAAQARIDTAFRNENARRIIAMCNPLNKPSWKLLERLGMRREGYLLQNIYFKKDNNGCPIWQDTYEYGILATEWFSRTV